MYTVGAFEFVANGEKCDGEEIEKPQNGLLDDADQCAAQCKGVSTWFLYDSGNCSCQKGDKGGECKKVAVMKDGKPVNAARLFKFK